MKKEKNKSSLIMEIIGITIIALIVILGMITMVLKTYGAGIDFNEIMPLFMSLVFLLVINISYDGYLISKYIKLK